MTNKEITLCFAFNLLTLPEDPRGFEKYKIRTNANRRRTANPEPFRKALKKWRANITPGGHAKVLAKKRQWCNEDYALSPEKYLTRTKNWNRQNRSKINARIKSRKAEDPAFRMESICRKRLWDAVTSQGAAKSNKSLFLFGVTSRGELKNKIEAGFKPGMNWENYGEVWEIDHKRPCASFDLSDPAQQRECFHWSNLQPLWVDENRKKGATCLNLSVKEELIGTKRGSAVLTAQWTRANYLSVMLGVPSI